MSNFKSRFFGELKPGLHFVLGSTNSGKTSVIMNDARDQSQIKPVEYINIETNGDILRQFFAWANIRICVAGYGESNSLKDAITLISNTTSDVIYIDFFPGLLRFNDSYSKILDFAVTSLGTCAKLFNKIIITTLNTNRELNISGTNREISEAVKKNVSLIFEITREERIIFINGKKFELDQYRNLKEIVKKEQTLLEAIGIINEEINSIPIYPEDHSYGLVYKYVSGIEVVEFLGQTIYRSDIEERIYDEDTDEYESYESFLRRVVGEISKDVYSIFCKLSLDKMN